ncbi:MAG: YaiI/YqxD family protein [Desulfuromonadales bacterium]|nr:MAG: YaiI/YqxD family protein [Desulfuromonadales bacterium]
MHIWIDADACPRIIKEIVFRASERLQVPVCLVANTNLSKAHSPLITSVQVKEGFDAADDHIVQHATPDDLVITADIPLAARIVAQGGVALDPRGELYTEENVGERLSVRNLMQELRTAGYVQGGPAQFGMADRQRFASALDRLLTRIVKGRR